MFAEPPLANRVRAADGASLYWEEEGDGPPVLFVHGGTGTGAFDWAFVREPLRRRYRLLVADLRGHGHSSDPAGRLALEQIGEDIETVIAAAGGCAAIVAFSIGASATLSLLCRRRGLVRAFVSIAASIAGDPARVEGIVSGPWPAELTALRHDHGTEPDHWRRLRRTLALSWSAHRVDAHALREMRTPTLVVSGDRDRVERLETSLTLARTLPEGELLVLPRCGHFVPRERPEQLASALDAFLTRVLADDEGSW